MPDSDKLKRKITTLLKARKLDAGVGYKPSKYQSLYIIELYNKKERFIKIGWSLYSVTRRFSSPKSMPYNYILHQQISVDCGKDCLEGHIQDHLKRYEYEPKIKFAGYTECFHIDCLETGVMKLLLGRV